MKKKLISLAGLSLLITLISGCGGSCKHDYDKLVVTNDAERRTYTVGSDFDETGLEVMAHCSKCHQTLNIEYQLENNTNLEKDQEDVIIKFEDLLLSYPITVKEKFHIACVGDSLTAGHMWASESYPTYLAGMVSEEYQVENCGVNGISITGYGGSWDDPNMRYIKQDVYTKSVNFAPDIFAIMLGTNDATGWANAAATFEDEYRVLLDSYIELFPNAKFIMMVSPPVVTPNQFNIPNDEIRDYVNPVQRELAEEYGFEVIDFREEFEAIEDFETKFLRPNNDNVHFTKEGAQYVASRVWEVAKELKF